LVDFISKHAADILQFLLDNADWCNVIAAACLLVPGIYFGISEPPIFGRYPHLRTTFRIWLLQWIVFVILWILFPQPTSKMLLLALIDFQSVLAIGFCFSFLQGNKQQIASLIWGLFILYAVVISVDLAIGLKAMNKPVGSQWRYAWIALSEVLSVVALLFTGQVFMLRYGLSALWLMVTNIIYAELQRPLYAGVFIDEKPQHSWFLAVAFGKLAMGAFFYLFFFVPLKDYPPLDLPETDPDVAMAIKHRVKGAGGFVWKIFGKAKKNG
jgi:hypothetical protein